MSNIKDKIIEYLSGNKEYQNIDGSLNVYKVLQHLDPVSHSLVKYLNKIKDKSIRDLLIPSIDGIHYLEQNLLIKILTSKEYVKNSTTFYPNKIGLAVSDHGNIVLNFPFKDCVFFGEMDKEDSKSHIEPFYHELLDKDKIDNLYFPKVLTGVKHYNNSSGSNLLVKGNNLIALHTLITKYEGKVDVIYIDPPFYFKEHKPADSFGYNSNFKFSTWLTFMKNRLEIAQRFLSPTGIIFISINEQGNHSLKLLSDEFLKCKFVRDLSWDKGNAQNDAEDFQENHEHILVYKKEDGTLRELGTQLSKVFEKNGKYFIDNGSITVGGKGGFLNARKTLGYSIYWNSKTNDIIPLKDYDEDKAMSSNDYNEIYKPENEELIQNGYVCIRPSKVNGKIKRWTWGFEKILKEKHNIRIKPTKEGYFVSKIKEVYKNEIIEKEGAMFYQQSKMTPPRSIINFASSGGKKILNELELPDFENSKNHEMIKYLISLHRKDNIMVMDFFAGSGTTAHAVLELNEEDGGNRNFILIEQMDYIKTLTSVRIDKVIKKHKIDDGFTYCELMKDPMKDQVKSLKNPEDLFELISVNFDKGYFQYTNSKEELVKELKKYSKIEDMKKVLIEQYFDHNREYIPYSDLKSVNLLKEDLEFNKKFYGDENE